MARPSELHFRAADTWLWGNFSISVQKKNLCVQKICCTTVTERTLAKVLSLSTWGNSYPRTKRKLLSSIFKIPPFSYALLWFQVVVPSFLARACDMRTRYSALSGASGKEDSKRQEENEKNILLIKIKTVFFLYKKFRKNFRGFRILLHQKINMYNYSKMTSHYYRSDFSTDLSTNELLGLSIKLSVDAGFEVNLQWQTWNSKNSFALMQFLLLFSHNHSFNIAPILLSCNLNP